MFIVIRSIARVKCHSSYRYSRQFQHLSISSRLLRRTRHLDRFSRLFRIYFPHWRYLHGKFDRFDDASTYESLAFGFSVRCTRSSVVVAYQFLGKKSFEEFLFDFTEIRDFHSGCFISRTTDAFIFAIVSGSTGNNRTGFHPTIDLPTGYSTYPRCDNASLRCRIFFGQSSKKYFSF